MFSNDIGIDLGTANTLVYSAGEGIIANEPSMVAVNKKTGQIVAIGSEAKRMVGRTPGHIIAIQPVIDGVISDFEVTSEMLAYFIKKSQQNKNRLFSRPRVVIGVPSGITNVEVRAVRDAARNAGVSEVYVVEEPMSAAIGARMPIHEPVGNMIVDIGGGTTDIAVISLGGVVAAKNMRIAGDRLNQNIIQYARDEFKILLGEKTAEDVKIKIGSVLKDKDGFESSIRGRDLITGLPREVIVTDDDIREAIIDSVNALIVATKEVIEETPPELVSDIMRRGIGLAGGGALLKGLAKLFQDEIKIPIFVVEDPLTAVVRGTGIILEDLEKMKGVLIQHEEDVSPN